MRSFLLYILLLLLLSCNNTTSPPDPPDNAEAETFYLGNIGTTRDYIIVISDFIEDFQLPYYSIPDSLIDSLSITREEYYAGINSKEFIHEEIVVMDSSRFPEFTNLFSSKKTLRIIKRIEKYSLLDEYNAIINNQTYVKSISHEFSAYYEDNKKLIKFDRIIYDSCYVKLLINKPLKVGAEWERQHDSVCYQKAYVRAKINLDTLGFSKTGFKFFIETGGSCGPDSSYEYWADNIGLVFQEWHWFGIGKHWINGQYIWIDYRHKQTTRLVSCNFIN